MTAYNFSEVQPYSILQPPYAPGQLYSIDFEYSLLGGVVTADTFTTPSGGMPDNGITIVDTQLIMVPLDTNASPTATISVGDSGSATRFINAARFIVTLGGTVATAASTGLIRLRVSFYCSGE
jgi:hypothetical protein